MIYNFNLGIGWASSGVEYAQSYRAKMFRNIGVKAKFIFTDAFVRDSLWDMTRNIGFEDDEVEWLYSYFTDFENSPTTFTLEDFKRFTAPEGYTYSREGRIGKLDFGDNTFYRVYFTNEREEFVSRVEMVVKQCLLRKDFYTSGRLFSEYYAPLDNQAHCYQRRFFNQDGSVAFDEIIDGDSVVYKFKNEIFYSKEDFVGYMVRSLKLTSEDIVIIDRTTGIGQSILKNAYPAKIGIVIHADHFSENSTDDDNILWNNYYEYSFANHEHIAFYITATDAQNKLLKLKGSLEEIADCFDKFQNENTPWMTERVNVWVKDSLGALKVIKERYSEYIDFTNGIAASGHSYGGDTAYRLALECDEVSCACNIDGALFGYKKSDVLTKPFYTFCCKENWNCESQFIINSKARCYSALFSKMKHIGFTDIKFFVKLGFLVGALDANVMHKHLLEGHMFMLDKYLKKVDCELNKSSSKFVEISECNRND